MDFKENIKSQALRLGFELVGITTPDPPPHFDIFEHWLEEGRHGEMAYLDSIRSRERRADPKLILPECRSIIVLGMRYPHPGRAEFAQCEGWGQIAAYAWGDDYHDLLTERMQHLVVFIEQLVGAPVVHRCYTDTGPILEREIAQRAGLGWIGKNTCLIHPGKGSYFLLSEILLGIDLQPDPPFIHDRCGTCTRCIEACPTGCILPDRTIDARRCISYLTIELKGIIPLDLRSQVGDWVFGCDICQQVCPWNERLSRDAPLPDKTSYDAIYPALQPCPGVSRRDLTSELLLTPVEFNAKFRRSPVRRAKRRGYLRNVAIAMGNTRPPAAAPVLTHSLLNEPEALVRAHAAWALGRINTSSTRETLLSALSIESHLQVIDEIRRALVYSLDREKE